MGKLKKARPGHFSSFLSPSATPEPKTHKPMYT